MKRNIKFESFIASYNNKYDDATFETLKQFDAQELLNATIDYNEVGLMNWFVENLPSRACLPRPFGMYARTDRTFDVLSKIKSVEMDIAILRMKKTTPEMHFLSAVMGNNIERVMFFHSKNVDVNEEVVFEIYDYINYFKKTCECGKHHETYCARCSCGRLGHTREMWKLDSYMSVVNIQNPPFAGWNAPTLATSQEMLNVLRSIGCDRRAFEPYDE